MDLSSMQETIAAPPLSPRRTTILALALGVLTAVNFWMRLRLGYNGPYLDESDYLYVGRLLKAGLPWNSYTYMFSSHIPLRVLALGESWGGLHGARAVAAVLGLCSLAFVVGATRALFKSTSVTVWAVALLSLAAPQVFISKYATYDVVCFCFFTLSGWLLIEGLQRRRWGWLWCLCSSIVFAVAVLSKYVVVVHAPILGLVVAIRRPRLLFVALVPCGLILADYAHRHWGDLKMLYVNQVLHAHAKNTTRMGILHITATYCAPVLGLALASFAMQISRTGVHWRALRLHFFLMALAAPLVAMHLRSVDMVSMFKHMVYPVAVLTPLAGWFLHRLSRRGYALPIGLVVVMACIGLYQTRQMEKSFVNFDRLVQYLRPRLGPTTTIISEEGYVFRYYFAGSTFGKHFHEFSWFDNNGDGDHTEQDVVDAVWDGKPDYVMVYGQLTPNLSQKLREAILPNQYHKVFEEPYSLSAIMTTTKRGTVELWKRNGAYKGQYPLPQ
jgi:hypothetical protein